MSLKFNLRAGEKLYVGNSTLIVASDERSTVILEGSLPVIRERDFVHADGHAPPLNVLRRAVQTYYLEPSAHTLCDIYKVYFRHPELNVAEISVAMQSVAAGELYRAIRLLREIAP